MRDLTGAPSYDFGTEEEDLETKLLAFDKAGYIMAASAGASNASAEALESLGLVAMHSYGLLAVHKVEDKFGDEVVLLQLRNPWGSFEWSGDWSDDSDCWSPAMKEQVGFTDEPDGTFWMCFEDLKTYFSRVQVCKINDSYNYHFTEASHKKGSFSM